jgi:exo-1,4-beta-D-glucosaminidase
VTALTVPASVSGLSTTYLARLLLIDSSGTEVSRNVYWLSTKADVIDWANNDWFFAPMSAFADLKGLATMPRATIGATATTSSSGDISTTRVTLRNTGTRPAVYLDAHVMAGSAPALPISWNDNAVSLWPGESTTLTATYRTADLHGSAPGVRITGWNNPTVTVPPDGSPGGPTRYEAEHATISQGLAESNHAGFSGTGFVNADNVAGSYVEFTVTAASAGPATIVIRYSNGTTVNRPMDIAVNGAVVAGGRSFPSTTNWDTWADSTLTVDLNAGINVIRLTGTTANGGPNVDYLDAN